MATIEVEDDVVKDSKSEGLRQSSKVSSKKDVKESSKNDEIKMTMTDEELMSIRIDGMFEQYLTLFRLWEQSYDNKESHGLSYHRDNFIRFMESHKCTCWNDILNDKTIKLLDEKTLDRLRRKVSKTEYPALKLYLDMYTQYSREILFDVKNITK